jgi:Tol biopolymer transport system component
VVNVTAAPGSSERAPAWGPGGNSLAFVSDRGGLAEIYIMDQVGGPARRLVVGYGPASGPAWWPAAVASGKLF